VLLSRDREELLAWKEQIEKYLMDKLKLQLNHKRQKLRPVSNGIDFLGYIVRRDYMLVRRRVINNLHAKLREYEALLVKDGQWFRRYFFDEDILDRLMATLRWLTPIIYAWLSGSDILIYPSISILIPAPRKWFANTNIPRGSEKLINSISITGGDSKGMSSFFRQEGFLSSTAPVIRRLLNISVFQR
jgi:hypothetical protein